MNDYPNRPLIGVGVIVLKGAAGAERVLLIRRGKAPSQGRWSLPGGRQRLGEKVHETACREVREETGCSVEVTALLDVVDSITRDPEGVLQYHYTLIDFLAEWRDGEAAAAGDAEAVIWADPHDLDAYDLWNETQRVIALALERRRA